MKYIKNLFLSDLGREASAFAQLFQDEGFEVFQFLLFLYKLRFLWNACYLTSNDCNALKFAVNSTFDSNKGLQTSKNFNVYSVSDSIWI